MENWQCTVCGYVYDPFRGDPSTGVAPGTPFESLPASWLCPACGAGQEYFQPYAEGSDRVA